MRRSKLFGAVVLVGASLTSAGCARSERADTPEHADRMEGGEHQAREGGMEAGEPLDAGEAGDAEPMTDGAMDALADAAMDAPGDADDDGMVLIL